MPKKTPSYRQRTGYDEAIVTLTDAKTRQRRDYWLGRFGSPESREKYHRLIASWEAAGRILPEPEIDTPGGNHTSIEELIDAYWKHANSYYPSSELSVIKLSLRLLRSLYGSTPAAMFGPNKLRLVRDAMVAGDPKAKPPRKPWNRKSINKHIHRLTAMFKWAASQELLPATVYQQLKTMEPLKRGRTIAPESQPVRAVADQLVDPIQPFVSRQVWALVQLQRLTGARCGELFRIRKADIEMDEKIKIWTFRPEHHKTAHHGHSRTIYFGPKAQEVLQPFLDRPDTAGLFSPTEAESERRAKLHAARKTPLHYGNRPGTNRTESPTWSPGDHYTTDSYRRAIDRGCALAFPPPAPLARERAKKADGSDAKRWETESERRKRLGAEGWSKLQCWKKEHRWHPHQLRHTAATQIRKCFGLEAAQIALGHSSALVTEAVYAERDMEKIIEMMKRIG